MHDLNGIVIWAHPLHGHEENRDSLIKVVELLSNKEINGVERIYNYKGKYTISDDFEKFGEKVLDEAIVTNHWLITSGGDFHGNVGAIGELELSKDAWLKFENALFNNY